MWAIVLILGLIAAVLVAVTSKADRPPIYHCVSVHANSLSLMVRYCIFLLKHLLNEDDLT